MVPDIFISHSHKDDNIADKVKEALERRGISCWVDHRDSERGTKFEEQIVEMIESSSVFILIFSSNVATSDHIPNEVGLAFEESVRIMPFRLDDTPYPRLFKYYLRSVNWLEAFPGPLDGYIDEMTDDVCRFIEASSGRKKTKAPDDSRTITGQSLRCLFIMSPDKDGSNKAGQQKEQGRLRDWLEKKGVACDYLEGRGATLDNVLRRLRQQKYDIIHFFGPIGFDNKDHALVLSERERLTGSMIKDHLRGNPIVVLDGDWSGKAAEGKPADALDGIAKAFLKAGAKTVVGSVRDIPGTGVRAFNEKFYEGVLGGMKFGEAIRQARNQLMKKDEYGKAWACFIMYGDQSQFINRKDTGDAQENVDDIPISQDDFEVSALHVVEQAIKLGRPMGGADTSHLFTALLVGQNDVLRRLLEEQGISPERLREDFLEIFRSYTSRDRPRNKFTLSNNFKEILSDARSIAKSRRSRITEEDILAAFVNRQGGSTGQFLREEFGIDVEALAPQFRPAPQPSAKQNIPGTIDVRQSRIGGARREDFTAEAWEVLAHSASIAKEETDGLVGSPQLFMGMYRLRNGALRRALNRLGFDLRQESDPGKSPAGGKHNGKDVQFTQNVVKLLKQAGEYAAGGGRDKVSDEDIMSAFVAGGGGETGKYLRSCGFELTLLTSRIFRDDGELDLSRFDDETARLLDAALEFARSRGNKKLRIVHLVHAMLLAEGSALAVLIRRQGKDPGRIAGLLARSGQMPVEGSSTRLQARASSMEPGLIRALCEAETRVKGRPIDGDHVTREILSDKSGRITRFLEDHGIKMEG
jgi:hypothetical protein